jgi:hypothetical protein
MGASSLPATVSIGNDVDRQHSPLSPPPLLLALFIGILMDVITALPSIHPLTKRCTAQNHLPKCERFQRNESLLRREKVKKKIRPSLARRDSARESPSTERDCQAHGSYSRLSLGPHQHFSASLVCSIYTAALLSVCLSVCVFVPA